jgi:hypothetical protein
LAHEQPRHLAGLQHDHQLAGYCPHCDRWSVLPLAALVAQEMGSLRLPLKLRCRDCAEVGRLQVRPPVPTLEPHRVRWIAQL